MSLINLITPEQAQGPIAEAFHQVEQSMGGVPQPLQMWAVSPGMFPVFMSGVGYLMQHPTLSQALLGWIRYLGAERDACKFCIDFNKRFLMEQTGVSLEVIDAVKQDPAAAPLPDNEKALLLLVLKAMKNGHEVTAEDIASVKAQGFSEQEIFDAVASGALVGMDDMLINTFKVE